MRIKIKERKGNMKRKLKLQYKKIIKLIIIFGIVYFSILFFKYFYPNLSFDVLGLSIKSETIFFCIQALLFAHGINVLIYVLLWDFFIHQLLSRKIPVLVLQLTSITVYFLSIVFIANKISSQSVVAIFTTLGGLGLIIGFGVQRLVLDAFSGISLNVDSAFKPGDYVAVKIGSSSFSGNVAKVSWRMVTLLDESGWNIMIPNNIISGNVVVNYSAAGSVSEFDVSYFFSPNENYKFVAEILGNALQSVAARGYILSDPGPIFRCSSITHNTGMKVGIYYYGENAYTSPPKVSPSKMKSFVNAAVLSHIGASGIQFYDSNVSILTSDKVLAPRCGEWDLRKMLLEKVSIFNDLNSDEQAFLLKNMELHSYPANFTIIKQGDEGGSLFILRQGFCKVHVEDETQQSTVVAVLDPGDFFGEMSLVMGERRRATVVSGSNVILYEVKKNHIAHLLKNNEELSISFAKYAAKRIAETQAHLDSMANKADEQVSLFNSCILKIKALFGT
jgi:small-conductance mechanosensitive channel